LEEGTHNPRFRSWVYTPASSAQDAIDWAQAAAVDLPYRVHADELVSEVVKTKLPYVLPSGHEFIFRYFLARSSTASPDGGDGKQEGPDNVVSIVFHSTHIIQDARPTLNAYSLVLEWMTDPVGPVTATGGPRPNWETEGWP